jgi:hypothetical protein
MEYITDRLLSDIWSQKRFYDSFSVRLTMVEIENEKIYDLTSKARISLSILNYQVKGANWCAPSSLRRRSHVERHSS